MKKYLIASILLLSVSGVYLFANGKRDVETPPAPEEEIIETLEEPQIEEILPPQPKYTLRQPEGDKTTFIESWGYVMQSRKDEYSKDFPITDVCYFAAEVNSYGELVSIPKRSSIDVGNARCHLVIICDSRSLSHFIIDPEYSVRKEFMNQIVKASDGYDGIQLDLEYIPTRDRKNYVSFIADLRYKLRQKGKMLSVCVPARFKKLSEDVYPYAEIASYCDRVIVMAYDEHWSTSKPGPVASPNWCKKVLDYAITDIPTKKLVMGVPFYGRSWADKTTAGAWYFTGANRIMTENGVEEVTYENDIPKFEFDMTVHVTGYFNDIYSVLNLCRMYEEAGVQKIGFWRIGQEDPEFWDWLEIK